MLRLAQFPGDRPGQPTRPALADGVVGLPGTAGETDDGGDEDHPAPPLAAACRTRPAWHPVRAGQVGVHHGGELSSLIRSSSVSAVMPALETRTSTGPARPRPRLNAASMLAGSVTSRDGTGCHLAGPPATRRGAGSPARG